MKVVLVCIIVLIAAATAFAYGQAGVSTGMSTVVSTGVTAVAETWTEPLALLLSGGALLGIAGAVRRMPF